jgi:hypothetical protein
LVQAVTKIAHIDADIQTDIVAMSHFIYCIVSYIANPALTSPQGELIYITISFFGFCFSKNNS